MQSPGSTSLLPTTSLATSITASHASTRATAAYTATSYSMFSEAFESDGYDSEAVALVLVLPENKLKTRTEDRVDALVPPATESISNGVWVLEEWPTGITFIREQFNPRSWKFPAVPIGIRGGAGCGCEQRCLVTACLNARESRYCTEQNCVFGGECGNGLREGNALVIARSSVTGVRGVVAIGPIPAGEVIGQYLGHVQLFGPPCRNGPVNDGFRMRLKTRLMSNEHLGIDALETSGKLRLMNHACICNPSARFHEVQTGRNLTVVAVTIRDISPGEVTVSYGDRLWFVCRCGWDGCQHRDIQHLPDIHKHRGGGL
ncbi:hypothetical protein PF011_g356 [Phytophthora fragariae]|uniref:SET domain-containing protein n=1 Tax=Phytophthora fragariae TaxID=53985 RepID=A0A6A3MNT6_9STRA|nr:hypothetical protein PF011_g356 [Phytophthora fragariae]